MCAILSTVIEISLKETEIMTRESEEWNPLGKKSGTWNSSEKLDFGYSFITNRQFFGSSKTNWQDKQEISKRKKLIES